MSIKVYNYQIFAKKIYRGWKKAAKSEVCFNDSFTSIASTERKPDINFQTDVYSVTVPLEKVWCCLSTPGSQLIDQTQSLD